MSLIRIDHHPSRRQLAVFGVIWAVFFFVVGWIVLRSTGSLPTSGVIWTMAVAVPLVGAAVPELLRMVYLGMAYATFPIGFVLSHVSVALVYYLVLVPTGLTMRLSGYDPMHRRFDREAETYWIARDPDEDVKRYFRQF